MRNVFTSFLLLFAVAAGVTMVIMRVYPIHVLVDIHGGDAAQAPAISFH